MGLFWSLNIHIISVPVMRLREMANQFDFAVNSNCNVHDLQEITF